jgi:hypothetical protein
MTERSDLEPPLEKAALPARVEARRTEAATEFAQLGQEIEPSIQAHIDAYEQAVEILAHAHADIADGTDIVIGAQTRWSAIWELAGRCLSECRLLVYALRGGFTVEASSNVRAVFEAMHLLSAVAWDDAIAVRWLNGDDIRPNKARAALVKRESVARTRMKEIGIEPMGSIKSSGEWLYRYFSDSAHHRRGPIIKSTSLERRQFDYGPHPDPRVRAREVSGIGHTIETALIMVSFGLADIVGRDGIEYVLAEQAEKLEQVRQQYPLLGPEE